MKIALHILLYGFLLSSCKSTDHYVVKMYANLTPENSRPNYEGYIYEFLISQKDLKKWLTKATTDTAMHLPQQLATMGAIQIGSYQGGAETFGCCAYGDINQGAAKYYKIVMADSTTPLIEKYNHLEVPQKLLSDNDGLQFKLSNGDFDYYFTAYKAKMRYCKCKKFHDTIEVASFHNERAFVTKMMRVQAPDTSKKDAALVPAFRQLVLMYGDTL